MSIEFNHDPDAIRTYGVYWGNQLGFGDTLASVSFTVPAGLTKIAEAVNDAEVVEACFTYAIGTVANVRLSGGTAGTDYELNCHVTTTNGDEDDITMVVHCLEK